MLLGMRSEDRVFAVGGLHLHGHGLSGGFRDDQWTEVQYADGAYSRLRFRDSSGSPRPSDYGEVVRTLRREETDGFLGATWRASSGLSLSLRVALARLAAEDESSGTRQETQLGSLLLSAAYGTPGGNGESMGGMFGAFGRLFGLGMAGVQDRLQPRTGNDWSTRVSGAIERGDSVLGSDAEYVRATAGLRVSRHFEDWSRLTLGLMGGWGTRLPESRAFTAGEPGALAGRYARDHRGDRLLAASLGYGRPFFRSRVGTLHTQAFADVARVVGPETRGTTTGAGLSIAYTFWRFPLPIGGGVTYGFRDRDAQFSLAVGGAF